MDRQEFIAYIREPRRLDRNSLEEIGQLSGKFPYCQSLKILYLLNLKIINHVMYGEQLKTTAACIADRKRLRELIRELGAREEGTGSQETRTVEIEKDTGPQESPALEEQKEEALTDIAVETETPPEKDPDPVVPSVDTDEEERLLKLRQMVETRLMEIALEKKKREEEKPTVTDTGSVTKSDKEAIIDKFIRDNPSISRSKAAFFDPVKVAKSSQEEKEGLVSETLAQIHLQQGNIAKAIEIYRKLSLKFPEKSSYFAAQIEKISTDN
jgi:hypothetical protein